MKYTYDHWIPIDIQLENIRLKDDILCLIDLQAEDQGEWDFKDENPLQDALHKFLTKIAGSPDSGLWKYLDPRIQSSNNAADHQ